MDIGELWPGHWDHFAGCVEFHGARAERNHAAIQRQIFIGQATQITQHFMFSVIAIERWMCQEFAAADQGCRNCFRTIADFCFDCIEIWYSFTQGKDSPDIRYIITTHSFVEGHTNLCSVDLT